MRQLVRNPLWLAGFAIQFIIGMPLNMLAQTYIGPAIIPGLMAVGLIVLAIGAVCLARESLRLLDSVGILLVMGAIALFGLSGLGVDMKAIDLDDTAFLIRLAVFTVLVASLSVTCHVLQGRTTRLRGVLRTLDAGLLFVQSNLWLGVLMGSLARWRAGRFANWDLLPAVAASCITFTGSMLGIAETQRAFQVGDAAKLVPMQSVPQQILPLFSYFAVFGLTPPSRAALPLAVTAAALILTGSALLSRRQASLS
ncbi:MAG: hypothetical protein ACM3XS_03570 [Bacteroidota bacterium]